MQIYSLLTLLELSYTADRRCNHIFFSICDFNSKITGKIILSFFSLIRDFLMIFLFMYVLHMVFRFFAELYLQLHVMSV